MDLCWTCQKNNNLIQETANLQEEQKVAAVRAQEEHLRLSAGERELYKTCCNQAKDDVHQSGYLTYLGSPPPCKQALRPQERKYAKNFLVSKYDIKQHSDTT